MDNAKEPKKLSLHRETVRELTDAELSRVDGAIPPWTPVIWTLPVNNCVAVRSLTPQCL
jgi:hypothetical protein